MKNILIYNVFFILSFLNLQTCQGQQNVNIDTYLQSLPKDTVSIPNNAIDLTCYLPKGYVTNASEDYTAYIQKGIDENQNVKMPNFPILVNTKGVKLRSNTKVYFQPQSLLKIMPNDKGVYQILRIIRVENVTVFNPNVEGDKYTHYNDKGQWGMGISIQGSTNIKVHNPRAIKCWGDGMYIANSREISSKNIEIYNAFLDDNRRNGISIISVDGLLIDGALITNTNLQNPQCGIDIEPNHNKNILKRIVLNDILTVNNNNCGIMISTGSIMGENRQNIDITINNHHDIGSRYAVGHGIVRHPKRLQGAWVSGNVKFINPIWEKNIVLPFRFFDYQKHGVISTFENVTVYDINGNEINLKKVLPRHKNIKIYQ